MHILTTLPEGSFVTAAFAELLADVEGLLSGAKTQKPQDKDEIKFWQAQFNALNKAELNWSQGVRPTLSATSYLIASASRPGALIHRLSKVGGIVVCSCEAGQKQTLCWHHMLINVLERAAELETAARKEEEISGGSDNTPESAAQFIAHGKEAAQWLAGQQLLSARMAATAAQIDAWRAAQQKRPIAHIGLRLASARRVYLEAA